MTAPGFSAEASAYESSGNYYAGWSSRAPDAQLSPQLRPPDDTCGRACDACRQNDMTACRKCSSCGDGGSPLIPLEEFS
jgi:hypothetical protein